MRPSPNLWQSPRTYEALNRAADPDGLVAARLAALAVEAGAGPGDVIVDLGCGTGFHLPLLHRIAAGAAVVGVEPHAPSARAAAARVRRLGLPIRVVLGTAEAPGLPAGRSALVLSHWAYFFGPAAEPGIASVAGLLRPGGVHCVVDIDRTDEGPGYARWLTEVPGAPSAAVVDESWSSTGYDRAVLPVQWRFPDRRRLAEVLGIEFPPAIAARALASTVGSTVRVPTVVRTWRRPGPVGPSG